MAFQGDGSFLWGRFSHGERRWGAFGTAVRSWPSPLNARGCGVFMRHPSAGAQKHFERRPRRPVQLGAEERQRITTGARGLLRSFSELAGQRGVLGQALYRQCAPSEVPNLLAGYARVSDLAIVPIPEGGYLDQLDSHWYLEAALFNSGRPVLVLPYGHRSPGAGAVGTVVIAWDHTRASARALADSMPILRLAKAVRLLTVTNEKAIPEEPSPLEVVSLLADHGIPVAYDAVDADGRDAATVIVEYLQERSASMLVMGGYGHSRMRELILGGTTKYMVTHPPIPILMSH